MENQNTKTKQAGYKWRDGSYCTSITQEDPSEGKEALKNWQGPVSVDLHACAQEIQGGVHLAATGRGLGLEFLLVHGDTHRTLDSYASASLDASKAAEELRGEIHTTTCPLLQTASPWPEVSQCFVNYVKTLLGLWLNEVFECAFAAHVRTH